VVIKPEKLKGGAEALKGGIILPGVGGCYNLKWDNSASRWSSKTLVYAISLSLSLPSGISLDRLVAFDC